MKPFPQLMFAAFVIVISFLFFLLVSMVVAIPLFGMDSLFNMPTINDLSNPGSIRMLKYFQVVQSFGLFIVPPFILAWLFHGQISGYLKLDQQVNGASVIGVIVLVIVSLPLVNLIGAWNMQMELPGWLSGVEEWMKNAEENATRLTEAFLEVETTGGLMFNLFMIALLPAVGEELLFRGVIQRIFTRWTHSHHWGIFISAFLFSSLHIQFYGFVPRLLLGVMFGYLLVWSGSMWLPIAAHFVNNGFAVIAMFLVDRNILSQGLEEVGSVSGSYYMAVVSFLLVAALLFFMYRENRGHHVKIGELDT